jgi:serine/threonine-protein kinase
VALTVVLTVLGLIAGAVAFAGTKGGGGPGSSPSPSISSPHSTSSPPGNQVAVPDVTGRTQAQATSALQAAGLTAAPTTTTNCGTADNGNVVTQDPAGGKSVAKGTSVTIGVCSAAPVTVTVPDVTGQTQAQATSALEAAGLTAAPTTTSSCTTADNGNVVTQNPAGGTSVRKGTSVTIGVQSGTLTVPNVIGESQAAAINTLQAQGLVAVTTTSAKCTRHNLAVITENRPQPAIAQGNSVTIGICNATESPIPVPIA